MICVCVCNIYQNINHHELDSTKNKHEFSWIIMAFCNIKTNIQTYLPNENRFR